MYISLSCVQSLQQVVVQTYPYFTPQHHLLLPFHNADETALLRVPTLWKLSLPQGCQVPHLGPVAFVVCCTISAVCVSPNPIGKLRRKTEGSIDEKHPNPAGTEEENRKIVGALNLLAPGGTLRVNWEINALVKNRNMDRLSEKTLMRCCLEATRSIDEKHPNLVEKLRRKTERLLTNCWWKTSQPEREAREENRRLVARPPSPKGDAEEEL